MAVSGANMALEGGDPRDKELGTQVAVPVSTGHKHHDNSVTFEEYHYWAKISRADERYENPNHDYTVKGKILKKSRHPPATVELARANEAALNVGDDKGLAAAGGRSDSDEKVGEKGLAANEDARRQGSTAFTVTDEEYVTASRAVRTATWGAVFYLITTDILGPFAVPWSMAAVSLRFSRFGFMPATHVFSLVAKFLVRTDSELTSFIRWDTDLALFYTQCLAFSLPMEGSACGKLT